MTNIHDQKLKAIILIQNWAAGKIPVGTEFRLKDSNRVLKLVECDGYRQGKFIFDNGEDFDMAKYFDEFFVEIKKENTNSTFSDNILNEDVWDEVDDELNYNEKGIIRRTFGSQQIEKSFKDNMFYDVTDILHSIATKEKNDAASLDPDLMHKYMKYLTDYNFPLFTKDKLNILFLNCEFFKTENPALLIVNENNKDIGYLVVKDGLYLFVPNNQQVMSEYRFESSNSLGFFYAAENYFDIALSTLKRYKNQFISLYSTKNDKSSISSGYQADASIKTLLAFSCECYLKALIVNNGKSLSEIKALGHGLTVLYTELSDELVGKIFGYMENNGYNINKTSINGEYETIDLTEKFMLDLAMVDDAFIDARYSAENDKNTNYDFLYMLALALRHCSKKELMTISPFDESIVEKIGKR